MMPAGSRILVAQIFILQCCIILPCSGSRTSCSMSFAIWFRLSFLDLARDFDLLAEEITTCSSDTLNGTYSKTAKDVFIDMVCEIIYVVEQCLRPQSTRVITCQSNCR
jgi:hypothetical protein